MALAFIDLGGQDGDSLELLVQLGDSEYFEYRVGRTEQPDRFGGVPLDEEAYRSELFRRRASGTPSTQQGGLLPWQHPAALSVRIPTRLFSREYDQVQVVGFRDASKNGPVYSQVLRVMSRGIDTSAYDRGLPGRTLSRSSSSTSPPARDRSHRTRCIALGFSESQLSHAQFVESLLGALQTLAPSLLESLPELLAHLNGSGSDGEGGEGAGAADGGDALAALARVGLGALTGGGLDLGSLDLSNLDVDGLDLSRLGLEGADNEALVNLLQQLAGALPAAAETSGPGGIEGLGPPPASLDSGSAEDNSTESTTSADTAGETAEQQTLRARHWSSPASVAARARRARARRQAYLGIALEMGPQSRVGLVTLLAPFLQRSPQLLSSLADRPLDLLGTLLRAQLSAEAPVSVPGQAAVRAWCRHSSGRDLLSELLRRRVVPALAFQASIDTRAVRPVETAHLSFVLGPSVRMAGREKYLYDASSPITLRAKLRFEGRAPQGPLDRAIARVRFIDTSLSRPVLEKEYQLRDVRAGDTLAFDLDASELDQVPRGRDLHVEASLRWPTPRGIVGVRGDHAIVLGEDLLFAGVGARVGREKLLADPTAYRHFWTKIWEGGTDAEAGHSRWELDVTCRFYARVTGAESENARMETRMMVEPRSQGNTLSWKGRLRSGLEVSLTELNALEDPSALGAEELQALQGADLRHVLDLAATTKLEVRGKERATGVVWAFVSVQRRELSFLSLDHVNQDGQVDQVSESKRSFPLPSSVHFLTMRTR